MKLFTIVAGLLIWSGEQPSFDARRQGSSDACVDGYVWREAFKGDRVCVLPEVRAQAAEDNRQAKARYQPGGGYTCRQGFVWREARPGDRVCVTPATRAQAAADNRAAASRRVAVSAPPPRVVVEAPPVHRVRSENISCPVREVTTEITTRLPDDWWQTPQVGRLQSTAVQMVGGTPTLLCVYEMSSFTLSVMRKVPAGMNACTAVTGGFRCEGR